MRNAIDWLKCAAVLLLCAAGVVLPVYVVVTDLQSSAAEPLEDEPGWSCTEHGNRVCGVQ